MSSSRHNWLMMPKPTFSPCIRFLHSGKDGNTLAIMWAVASPPLSKPNPESSTLASITFSTAGVSTLFSTARLASMPWSSRMSKQSRASAMAAWVETPPPRLIARVL